MSSHSSKDGIQADEGRSNKFDPVGHIAYLFPLLQLCASRLSSIIPEHERENCLLHLLPCRQLTEKQVVGERSQ